MATRRAVLAGLLATGLTPRMSWADAGGPAYLSAALRPDGVYVLCGIGQAGELIFQLPLPNRGHAAAAHPDRPEAIAFARRPGRFALVIDCARGSEIARLQAPMGRHFYGHGVFSADGSVLYTTENDYERARGVVGLWDAAHSYRRMGEVFSGGVGPHDILRLPGTDILAVANGGIETHPETGRAKLNLPDMASNLSYLAPDGDILDVVELGSEHQLNSIRHLDVAHTGEIAFALQWQGDPSDAPPLLGLHRRDAPARLMCAPDHYRLNGYAGSVAITTDGQRLGISSPRGGIVQMFDAASTAFLAQLSELDVCGLSQSGADGLAFTSGQGVFGAHHGDQTNRRHVADLAFDNHLIRIAG
ncbi:DUF1513 domain-containing protein [Gymnodinialimonas sp. 2305UL16-5]|uniref:DUF1513 domain-containing protein n=1 Tax=Gymnodinialimonas mytili TaxID=3126503 RepID=UPI0030B714FF